MRTYKNPIAKSKFERVRMMHGAVPLQVNGQTFRPVTNTFAAISRYSHYKLGDFIYVESHNKELGRTEYFRYRVKPIAAFTVDYGYYEWQLQIEERKVAKEWDGLMQSVSEHSAKVTQDMTRLKKAERKS